ncbi:MAG: DUF4870 domain-containing protein [Polaribacter sp.]
MLHLSILSFLGIPFKNIIFPFILWRKNHSFKFINEVGMCIVNFQIFF